MHFLKNKTLKMTQFKAETCFSIWQIDSLSNKDICIETSWFNSFMLLTNNEMSHVNKKLTHLHAGIIEAWRLINTKLLWPSMRS